MTKWRLLVSGLLVLVAMGCGFASAPTTPEALPTQPPLPAGAIVEVIEMIETKMPSRTIEVGTTVRWINKDTIIHAVMHIPDILEDEALWKSSNLRENDSFQYTFNEVGVYRYRCQVHTTSRGTITVVEKGELP